MKRSSRIVTLAAIAVATSPIPQVASAAPRVAQVAIDAAGGTIRIQGSTKSGKVVIDCGYAGGNDCAVDVRIGAVLTLTAGDGKFYAFSAWAGDCTSSGSSRSCVLRVDSAKSVTALSTGATT